MTIEPMTPDDWPAVARIYGEGIAGHATFEAEVPTWEQWNAEHLAGSRLVARRDDELLGWAALSPVSDRCAYGGVAEVSVYVASKARETGMGRQLLGELIRSSETAGIWTLQAGIFPENAASIRMHTKAGFRVIGTREKLGQMNGIWRDVTLLERRSTAVGF